MFGDHVFSFAQSDTVLAGGGTAQLKRFRNQALSDLIDPLPLGRVIFFAGNVQMHISVSSMADLRTYKVGSRRFFADGSDQIGIGGNRHRYIHNQNTTVRMIADNHFTERMAGFENSISLRTAQSRL